MCKSAGDNNYNKLLNFYFLNSECVKSISSILSLKKIQFHSIIQIVQAKKCQQESDEPHNCITDWF
jgi:hypothetical protein